MTGFVADVASFVAGSFEATLHPKIGLLTADKTLLIGKDAVAAYLADHPELFAGLGQISPDSPVTVTLKNAAGNLIKLFSTDEKIGKIVEFHPLDVRQRIRLVIAYDGTDFAGFQIQPMVRTVQQELEKVLSTVNDHPTAVTGASRTDTGVHALGQVVHFDTKHDFSEAKWKMILNHALPHDISVVAVEKVHPLFHARYDVIDKEYRYIINLGEFSPLKRNFEWTVERTLDLACFERELKSLVGTFDFASFCKGENNDTVRTILSVSMETTEDHLMVSFVGDGFLHNMIRLLIGSLVDIASGKSKNHMLDILAEKNRKHTQTLAFSGGLYLVGIRY